MTNAEYQRDRLANGGESLLRFINAVIGEYTVTEGVEIQSAIRDALTDLRHLCDIHELDFAEIDKSAYQGYLEELEWRNEE